MQEAGEGGGKNLANPDVKSEWPYEGVYRVKGSIPVGYRIGGTSICALALLHAPGYDHNEPARGAVKRAAEFVVGALDHPLMNPDYDGGYDVRGWGYTYALYLMLALLDNDTRLAPEGFADSARATAKRCIKAIEQTEITKVGGWNYARATGKDAVSPPSPFMTGPTLQALFEARRLGFDVDAGVVDRALACLESARTRSGSIVYAGVDGAKSGEPVPGSIGRMLVTETTLYLAGRSDLPRVRGALDAFFVHWEWIEKRRKQTGTHVPPYAIAPYYFFYAHYYAAQAIEMLPPRDRAEYRRRLADLLFKVREENGSWNDRVFDRSANYGTAIAMLSLSMDRWLPPSMNRPIGGKPKPEKPEPPSPKAP
jgi:hypothetical protein